MDAERRRIFIRGKQIGSSNNNKSCNRALFNEGIMMAIIQEDENSNTSRRRVLESPEY
jgi:hypothetical protein